VALNKVGTKQIRAGDRARLRQVRKVKGRTKYARYCDRGHKIGYFYGADAQVLGGRYTELAKLWLTMQSMYQRRPCMVCLDPRRDADGKIKPEFRKRTRNQFTANPKHPTYKGKQTELVKHKDPP